jgi:hypothetical protein
MPDPQPVEGGYAPDQDVPLGGYALLTLELFRIASIPRWVAESGSSRAA